MLIIRSQQTKRNATIVLLIGRNVKPKRSHVAKFLGIDETKAKFKASTGLKTNRVYVQVKCPVAALHP